MHYYCHYDQDNVVIEANFHEIWAAAWHAHPPAHYYHTIMIQCPVPQNIRHVESVLVTQDVPCDHQHGVVLPVKDTAQLSNDTYSFCACVKPLDFPQEPRIAPRLMEWIESNLQLGARKIVIYVYSGTYVHYYHRRGGRDFLEANKLAIFQGS